MATIPSPFYNDAEPRPLLVARRVCAGVALALGIAALIGWALDVETFRQIRPTWASMKANTAIGFVLAGVATLFGPRRWVSILAAGSLLLLSGLTMFEIVTDVDLGIDQSLFREVSEAHAPPSAARMAPFTAAALMGLAIALLLQAGRGVVARTMAMVAALVALLLGGLELVGYVYGVSDLYWIGRLTAAAAHTGLALVLLSVGVLLRRPGSGLAWVSGPHLTAMFLKRALPIAAATLFLVGWFVLFGWRKDWFDAPFAIAVFTIVSIGSVTAVLLITAIRMRRVEEKSQVVNEQLRIAQLALDNSRDGIVIADALGDDHPVVYVNEAFTRLTGYPPHEVLGRNCRYLNQHDRDQKALDEVRAALREGRDTSVVLLNRRRDGTPFWNDLSISPIRDESGRVINFVGILVDASEWVKANEERERLLEDAVEARRDAQRATRARDEFLSLVSHELRAPLHAMAGWSGLLADDPSPGTARRAATVFRTSLRSQTRLINDLLDVSRILSGKLYVDYVPFDFVDMIEELVEAHAPNAEDAGIDLRYDGSVEPLFVNGDEERLAQVGRNLIGNALKFTPAGGQVRVAVERRGERILLRVADSGEGIEPELLPRVFEKFRQGSSSRGGLGLGLAIVAHIVELHDGTVTAKSEGRGRGASFLVDLPLAPTPDLLPARGRSQEELERLDGIEVLIVDDDEVTLEAIEHLLRAQGASVRTSTTSARAASLLAESQPDVLVTDLNLGLDSGFDVVRALRANEKKDGLRAAALAISGRIITRDERRELREIGGDAFLPKPIDPARLTSMIHRMSRRRTSARVLVVDDDRDAAELLGILLSRAGHAVERAYDADQALEVVGRFAPNVVVTDVALGGTSGVELARRIREEWTKTIVIAVTGTTPEGLGSGRELFDEVIVKPVDVGFLRERISFHLASIGVTR